MTSFTSFCEMACQIVQKKQKEKRIEEEQAAKAQSWKLPVCYDDDNDEESSNSLNNNIISELPLCVAVTPNEPVDSLIIEDDHLDTIPATESDEFIKSSFENLVLNPSESDGENECDVPAGFTTFSNVLFDADYDSDSSDDQSLSDEDFLKKIYSNPLFDEEIILMEIDQHSFNVESDLIESMPNHDSSVIISLKIDSLFDEFAGELTLLKSISSRIDETNCHPEKEIRLAKRLLYDNSSPRPPKEIVSDNSNADIESFSPSLILNLDNDPLMKEIDLSFNSDDPMPLGIEEDDDDSERDIPILEELLDSYSLSLLANESYHFDIPSPYRPPTKPPDGNTGTLNIKMMGNVSDQKNSFDCTLDSYHPSHPIYETYSGDTRGNDSHLGYDCSPRVFKIKDAFENKQYKPEDVQELFRGLFNDVQNIHEELAEYINTPGWNRPAFYNNGDDDDEDYTIAITLDFLITDSLIMGDEHLDTIPEKESDEFNKSSVKDLVPNPREFEDECECDVPDCDDS
nr:hypothetical protein [Tanacetum cinerariifolium]